ncbi:hypothetical protein ACWEPC_49495, partial [Nonomuraea sp. NPDC004297]
MYPSPSLFVIRSSLYVISRLSSLATRGGFLPRYRAMDRTLPAPVVASAPAGDLAQFRAQFDGAVQVVGGQCGAPGRAVELAERLERGRLPAAVPELLEDRQGRLEPVR